MNGNDASAPPCPAGHPGRPDLANVDFGRTPFTVAWELTRACALACVHCRAAAQPRRDPRELSTEEGHRLIDQFVDVGSPILIVTGGDPMMRRDLFDLVGRAHERGLRVAFSPSATRLVTAERLRRARDAGVARTHISLDGGSAATHDAFRKTPGSFQRSMEIMDNLRSLGMSLQIGCTVTRSNVGELPRVAEIAAARGAVMLNFFFLVPVGRGDRDEMISPEEHERVLNWMYELSRSSPFDVRSTAAPHYRRVVIQRRRAEGGAAIRQGEHVTGPGFSFAEGLGQSTTMKGVNDGNGFAFVSHVGDVCPSGFLDIPAGNVRETSFAEIYRDAPLFRALRDPARIKGRCGACDVRDLCGGSRARAYGVTGDYLESDPYCVHIPRGWTGSA